MFQHKQGVALLLQKLIVPFSINGAFTIEGHGLFHTPIPLPMLAFSLCTDNNLDGYFSLWPTGCNVRNFFQQLEHAFVDKAINCVYPQCFLKVFLSPSSNTNIQSCVFFLCSGAWGIEVNGLHQCQRECTFLLKKLINNKVCQL